MNMNMLTGEPCKTRDEYSEELINSIASESGELVDWKAVAKSLAGCLLEEMAKKEAPKPVNADILKDYMRRVANDLKRIEIRKDQVDKRAFQEAVRFNIDDYTTKADAIKDLRINSQFENYPDKTLRGWLTDSVWTKPTKAGRPKKK